MSQNDKIELIRRAEAAFNHDGPWPVRDFVTDDVEWGTTGSFPGIDCLYRGPAGMDKWRADMKGVWQSFAVEVVDVLDEDDDTLVVEERVRGRGLESGLTVEMSIFSSYAFRGEKLERRTAYPDREAALQAIRERHAARPGAANVAITRRALEKFADPAVAARGDLAAIAAEFIAPEGEWRPALTAGGDLERRVYRGPEGLVRYFEDLAADFEDTRFQVKHIEPVGSSTVLLSGRVTARGRASGIPLDIPIWAVYVLSAGKIVRGEGYLTESEARAAAGR